MPLAPLPSPTPPVRMPGFMAGEKGYQTFEKEAQRADGAAGGFGTAAICLSIIAVGCLILALPTESRVPVWIGVGCFNLAWMLAVLGGLVRIRAAIYWLGTESNLRVLADMIQRPARSENAKAP
jgi:hypothetical protein